MGSSVGRGILGSLRRRAQREIDALRRANVHLRRARYPWLTRLFRLWATDRPMLHMVGTYVALDLLAVAAQVGLHAICPRLIPDWTADWVRDLMKDITSYFLGGQLAILGVASVAVGIVTLLAQRSEGVSARTDIRLYYVESFAYELVASSIALSMVLAAQLFWPAQWAATLLGLGGDSLAFKVALSGVHAAWLGVNLLLFHRFLLTTLRFVEPNARARLREHFTANIMIPTDLESRLINTLFLGLGEAVGGAVWTAGPSLAIGRAYARREAAVSELASRFGSPARLVDVWQAPLQIAFDSWAKRVRRTGRPQAATAFSEEKWPDSLIITVWPNSQVDGETAWLYRTGDTPLRPWERWLIRASFRFARDLPEQRELPGPQEFIEELAEQVIGHINRTAETGFRIALAELTRFHTFLLEAQAHVDAAGNAASFAQVGGIWSKPHEVWVEQYRRVYFAAARVLGEDTRFIDRLSYLTVQLLPKDATRTPAGVLAGILYFGVYEVQALQGWLTRHTSVEAPPDGAAAPRLVLAGSDRRAYEQTVLNFVGAWEHVASRGEEIYRIEERRRGTTDEAWAAYCEALPFLRAHLSHSFYMLASAVWNEDSIGSDQFRDMVVRWPERLDLFFPNEARLRRRVLVTPSWGQGSFASVAAFAAHLQRLPPSPGAVANAVLSGVFDDGLTVCAAVALSWSVRGVQSTDIGAATARQLLLRQGLDGEGRPPRVSRDHDTFRTVLGLIVRTGFTFRSGPAYEDELDTLVQRLNGMEPRRIVPGRVYTSWGSRGIESLHPELLAILAAFQGDAGERVVADFVDALADTAVHARGDLGVADGVHALRRFADGLGPLLDRDAFAAALGALAPGVDPAAARDRLSGCLADFANRLQALVDARLAAAPAQAELLRKFTDDVAEGVRAKGLGVAPFAGFALGMLDVDADPGRFEITNVAKGRFTDPPRTDLQWDDMVELIVDDVRRRMGGLVWRAMGRRRKQRISLATGRYPENLWLSVRRRLAAVGPEPVLLVSYDQIGQDVAGWVHGYGGRPPEGLDVAHVEHGLGVDGAQYVGTVSGVHVFTEEMPHDRALLFSAAALREIACKEMPGGQILQTTWTEEAGGQTGALRFDFGVRATFDDSPVVEFRFTGPWPEDADGT
ncbi:MAG: hypothetical protein U1C74_05615 [Phenylobacterium sp.]|nr:hypothetical protein [Phenylobacterium sp.]